jgi:hypothetical protein
MSLNPATVTSVIDALTTLRDELTARSGAPSPQTVRVGDSSPSVEDTAVVRWLDSIPVGAEILDNDGDTWVKHEDGYVIGTARTRSSAQDVSEYAPLEITSLPEAEPVYTAGGQKVPAVGDRIKVIRGFHDSSIINGKVGVLREIRDNYNGSGRTCFLVELDDDKAYASSTFPVGNRTAGEVEVIEAPAAAASLFLDITSPSGYRQVRTEPTSRNRLALTIRSTPSSTTRDEAFVHLSTDNARDLVATLQAFINKETTS